MQQETKTICVIGNGVVIDPKFFLQDIQALEDNSIDYKKRLLVSQR